MLQLPSVVICYPLLAFAQKSFTSLSRPGLTEPLPNEKAMNRRDLSRLKTLQDEEPAKLSRLVGILWPDIRAAINRGHTLKFIAGRLQEIGIPIKYRHLLVYVSRLRRADANRQGKILQGSVKNGQGLPPSRNIPADHGDKATRDPLANIKDRLIHNRPGFNYDDQPPDKDKLIG
jgi:hypothetical protein